MAEKNQLGSQQKEALRRRAKQVQQVLDAMQSDRNTWLGRRGAQRREIGGLLAEARELLDGTGTWEQWVTNCRLTPRTACNYMKEAKC